MAGRTDLTVDLKLGQRMLRVKNKIKTREMLMEVRIWDSPCSLAVWQTFVRPRICWRMKTRFACGARMYFTEERQTAIEVSIPGY